MSLLATAHPNKRGWMSRVVVAIAALAIVAVPALVATPAYAADAAVVITQVTPASTTVQSGQLVTYNLNITCNGPGTCDNTVVSFPTGSVTGNGSNTNMATWFGASSCPEVTRSVVGNEVRYSYGTVPTGVKQCTFTVRAPNYTTLNGAQSTITPTVSGSTFASATGAPATLTFTAGHNAVLTATGPQFVVDGTEFTYSVTFACGDNNYDGDIGFSAIAITAQLPANFVYASYSTRSAVAGATITPPAVGSSGGVLTFSSPNGAQCGNPPLNNGNYQTIRIVGTISGPVGSQGCVSATSSYTYIDGVTGNLSSTQSTCTTTMSLQTVSAKGSTSTTWGGGTITYPGNWDQSGRTLSYTLSGRTNPAALNAGVSYGFHDAMPCLTNLVGGAYQSNALGTLCQSPAFIPTRVTAVGFTPTTADAIILHFADGSTQSVAYAAGAWTLPAAGTGGGVAEIEIPPFPGQESNTANNVQLVIAGYAAAAAVPGNALRNSSYTTAYYGGGPVSPAQLSTATNVTIADPKLDTTGDTILYPSVFGMTPTSGCIATTGFVSPTASQRNHIQFTKGPSEAIYLDYLAPAGASITGSLDRVFTAVGLQNGQTFTSTSVTPTVTTNYNSTGRTLYQWVIPAGTITVPGAYRLQTPNFATDLGPGCAGTFQNDVTLGYGSQAAQCLFNNNSNVRYEVPPMIGTNNVLTTNAGPITNNYCGYSSNFSISANNAQYSLNKTVQGNLDPSPATGGALGHVSPTGGQATYVVSFSNPGSVNLTDPVMYDILPRVGDTRASSLTPRESAFNVTLLSVGTLPANTSIAYSTAANPCRPEVLPNASNPGCVNDWSTTPPTPLSATTALRISYAGTIGVPGSAFPNSISVPYTVSTPNSTSGSIAYNTVGINVIAGTEWFGAAESDRVGLQAAENQPEITKSASVTEFDSVGDTITYTFTVTNNTTVTLTNVGVTDVITDAAPGATAPAATCVSRTSPAASCSGATTTLAAGQSATFTATYTVRQADLDYGSISDNATSHGTPPTGGALSGTSNTVTVDAVQAPELSLVKSADVTTVDSVGDTITYSFEVTNEGNVTVSGLAIDETDFSGTGSISTITCPTGPLAPGASATCTATYSVTQEDLTAGVIDNSAVAMATAPGATIYSDESSASVDVDQTPSLSLVKSASPSEEASYNAGQVITYSFVVTNTGNIPVDDITINELDFTGTGTVSAIDCPVTTLAPAAQTTCTATYTLTQDDVDALILENTANATGTSVAGPVTSNDSSAATPQVPDASLALTKTASTAFVNGAGEVVTYTFAVRNNGNVTIHDIAIDETDFTGSGTSPVVTCPTTSLIPGGIVNCTGTYTVTQADMNAGSIENTAVATGLDPSDNDVESAASDWTITANVVATLSLSKTADVDSYAEVGATIEYSFEVTNTGNVTIEGVTIDESAFTGSGVLTAIDCPTGSVDPDDSVTCTAQYEVTQEDIDRGSIVNTATAGAYQLGDDELIESEESTVDIPAVIDPEVTLVKSATPTTVDEAGAVVAYEFLVTNTGNVTLTGVAITETVFTGTGGAPAVTCASTPLEPGADMTCTATYIVTQADVDAGALDNTAIATATAGAEEIESEESSASVAITRTASLSLVKSADPASPEVLFAGDTITYSFVVTNTGNVTITNPGISETEFTGTGTLPDPTCDDTVSLAPGDQFICQIVYTVTQEDVDAGTLSNTAQATGTAPAGTEPLVPPTDTVAIPSPAAPGLELVKETTTEKLSSVGQLVTYTFSVTNTGNTTVTGLEISEDEFTGQGDLGAVECPSTTVLPGQTIICEVVYQVVAEDLDGTALENTATATGESAGGEAVVSDASSVVISDVVDARPPLAFTGATVLWGAGSVALAMLAAGGLLFFLVKRRSREQNAA